MKDVLVDTSVWSLALQRAQGNETATMLSDLIDQSRVQMIGPIRQELLSGIKSQQQRFIISAEKKCAGFSH